MAATKSLDVELHFLADGSLNVVAPRQAGISFEAAAAAQEALAEALSVELGLPVRVVAAPERHTHGPEQAAVRTAPHTHVR
jgi:hypothetical protein